MISSKVAFHAAFVSLAGRERLDATLITVRVSLPQG